jgi:type IV secretion system protein VirB11
MKHSDDRIILIEDTRELQCQAPNAVYMQTTRDFTARDALRASLRFNPDRILLGEVRDASAYDLLKAMNTGHEGGFTTLHANSAADALVRLEDLIKEAPNITTVSKPLMASAIHYLLFLRKSKSGRHLEEILELHGVRPDGSYDLRPIDTPSSPPSPDTSRRRIIRC